jgi:hypothetical protein
MAGLYTTITNRHVLSFFFVKWTALFQVTDSMGYVLYHLCEGLVFGQLSCQLPFD